MSPPYTLLRNSQQSSCSDNKDERSEASNGFAAFRKEETVQEKKKK